LTKEQLKGTYKTYQDLPLTPVTSVNSAANRTGFWKTFKPVLDPEKCIKCGICWKFCPDVAVKMKPGELPTFDLEHCKGCGICANECPKKAITMVMEGDV
jgi:2-oxoisovalerate ferredoxin oxidoreductase delta subunit